MEKKIYVLGLDSDIVKTKTEEAIKALDGVNSVIADCNKAQVFVNYEQSIPNLENEITTALESAGLTVLN